MRYTLPALYALFQIDFVRALYRAGNCVCGTIARAKRTAAAFVRFDIIIQKRFAHARRALLFVNMRPVFVAEVFHCGNYGVGRRLTECTQGRTLHMLGYFLNLFQIFGFAVALDRKSVV